MEELTISLDNNTVTVKQEASDYFELVGFFALVKEDINKYLMKMYNGEYTLLLTPLKVKIEEIRTHMSEKLDKLFITDVNINSYMEVLYSDLISIIDENYYMMIDEIKIYAPEVVHEKLDEFKKSHDRSLEMIMSLAEQYDVKKEIERSFKLKWFPTILKRINESVDNLCSSLLSIYKEKLNLDFNTEKGKVALREIEVSKNVIPPLLDAIEAYPLAIIEDSEVLIKLLDDYHIHDELIKLIKFLHAQKQCFATVYDDIKNSFYNDSLENHKEKYKDIYYKSLRYREEISKKGAVETIEKVYTEIYNDVISKILTIEDFILNEKRVTFVSSMLNKNREEVMLKLLKRIESKNIIDYKERKNNIQFIDKNKTILIAFAYSAVLIFLLFFKDFEAWDKIIWIYIYLFFGFLAYIWYTSMLKESVNKYIEVYNNFKDVQERKTKLTANILSEILDEKLKLNLANEYLITNNPEIDAIERDYKNSSNLLLLSIDNRIIASGRKKTNVTPIITIVLFIIWIILLICGGIFA